MLYRSITRWYRTATLRRYRRQHRQPLSFATTGQLTSNSSKTRKHGSPDLLPRKTLLSTERSPESALFVVSHSLRNRATQIEDRQQSKLESVAILWQEEIQMHLQQTLNFKQRQQILPGSTQKHRFTGRLQLEVLQGVIIVTSAEIIAQRRQDRLRFWEREPVSCLP